MKLAVVLLLLVACFVLSAPGTSLVTWDTPEFTITFEPGEDVLLEAVMAKVNVTFETGEEGVAEIPRLNFRTEDKRLHGQISVARYSEPQDPKWFDDDCLAVIIELYRSENVTGQKKIFYKGQEALAVSYKSEVFGDATTANVMAGCYVMTVSSSADVFDGIIKTLSLQEKPFG